MIVIQSIAPVVAEWTTRASRYASQREKAPALATSALDEEPPPPLSRSRRGCEVVGESSREDFFFWA